MRFPNSIISFHIPIQKGKFRICGNIVAYMFFCCLLSCMHHGPQTKEALNLAGNNKKEIQKFLGHYSQAEDSLKYKAVIFLLENMLDKGHSAIDPSEKWKALLEKSAYFVKNDMEAVTYKKKIDSMYSVTDYTFEDVLDLRIITAEELIKNIDLAFKVWPRPWNGHLDFNDFCNLILPYKSKDEPFDIGFRERFYEENIERTLDCTAIGLAKDIGTFPQGFNYYRVLPMEQSMESIEKGHMADCLDYANFAASKARSIGLPMVVDHAIWPNGRGFHYWNALVYNIDSLLYADKDFFWGTPKNYGLRRKVSKIYRYNFAKKGNSNVDLDTIPKAARHLYDPHFVDVTDQYLNTVSVDVPIVSSIDDGMVGKTAYLCVFNNLKWTPIDKTPVIGEYRVFFDKIGCDNIHTVFLGDGKKMAPISRAFTVDKYRKVRFFGPDLDNMGSVMLNRKTKVTIRVKGFGIPLLGAKIEFSNSVDFANKKVALTIKDTLISPISRVMDTKKEYRYARLIGKAGIPLELAELHFYSRNGRLDATLMLPNEEKDKKAESIVDNNALSYYTRIDEDGEPWVGFDFGKKVAINSIGLTPRTDLNYIVPDNIYELLYWDIGWKSLGTQTAKSEQVLFKNVPENAVLWLRNHSGGNEEDLFVYKDGEQVFWNSSEYEY